MNENFRHFLYFRAGCPFTNAAQMAETEITSRDIFVDTTESSQSDDEHEEASTSSKKSRVEASSKMLPCLEGKANHYTVDKICAEIKLLLCASGGP